MINSYAVGATFKIINEASAPLKAILKQVRELSAAIDAAKVSISGLGKTAGLTAATAETRALAGAWREVGKAAASASRSIGAASKRSLVGPGVAGVAEAQQMAAAWERIAIASAASRGGGPRMPGGGPGGGGGGGGGRNRLMHRGSGGGGVHISGPAIPVAGGGHVRVGGNMGGAALATAGLVGYGAYEAAQMEDTVFQMMYHAGLEYNDTNRLKMRNILQESMRTSGYGLHDIAESATQEIRMFNGTDGAGSAAGLEVLPEMLKAATTEARLKGGNPKESMQALIGLAHMTKEYGPDAIKALAKDFAFLSIANPSSLGSMEKAASYAVPILQSGLGIDPRDTLLLGTALTRAGATNTKSGTWLREAMVRAMPGTSIFESEKKAEHHDELLKKIGLLDDDGKVTWKTDGKLDPLKMLQIAHEGLGKLSIDERAGAERKLFGAQGSGAISLLSDNAVYDQVRNLRAQRDSPEWANRYGTFSQAYLENSTVQNSRTAMQDFNITMMDIGQQVLPAVNGGLKDFKRVLEAIDTILPKAPSGGGSTVLTRAAEFAALGGGAGFALPVPGGMFGGAVAGGAYGVAKGYMESYRDQQRANGVQFKDSHVNESMMTPSGVGLVQAIADLLGKMQKPSPSQVTLAVDGKSLASVMVDVLGNSSGFVLQAPTADGLGQFYGGDHNTGN
jgi:hypothetical protein